MRVLTLAVEFVLVGAGLGCTSMQTVQPQQFIPLHKPKTLWVWMRSMDSATIVSDPKIEGDTLTGVVFPQTPWTAPLKDIARIDADAPDVKRTVLLVTAAAASAVGVIVLANRGSATPNPVVCRDPDVLLC
jgi:hypothetical protein